MTLKEYLEGFPDDKVFYLCPKVGRIFGGTKQQFGEQRPALERECAETNSRARTNLAAQYNAARKTYGEGSKQAKEKKKALDALMPFEPFLEREVLETYEITTEVATNVIVPGSEPNMMKEWSVHENEPDWATCEVNYNAESVIMAVYRQATDDLRYDLRRELDAFADMYEKRQAYMEAAQNWQAYYRAAKALEDWINLDGKEDYIVKKARQIVAEEIAQEQKRREKKNGVKTVSDVSGQAEMLRED